MGILFVISGPSGVGKGTILELIMNEDPTVKFSVSATTRSPRPGEQDGVHYFFVDRKRFDEMIENSEMLEWAVVHGDYKGTIRKAVADTLAAGFDIILDIDVQGALQLMDRHEDGVFVFIAPPSMEELARRLRGRGTENEEQFNKRLKDAAWELAHINRYEYVIINDDLSEACRKLRAIITAERCRTKYLLIEIK